jgi:CRISPR/Cas system-associated endonuclease Cas1
MYINNPRFVLPLSNINEITKSSKINKRLIVAMIDPMIVIQFLEEGGSFIVTDVNG